jgi:FdhD protein
MDWTPTRNLTGLALRPDGDAAGARLLAEEAPVAVVCNGTSLAVMMATPADLADFALGFALTEGIVQGPSEVLEFEEVAQAAGIEARLWIAAAQAEALARRRRFMAGPVGCGLCGIDSLDQAMRPLPQLRADLRLSRAEVLAAPLMLRAAQPLYGLTRATHAAGFLVPGCGIVLLREDVGRHNALDKLIGALLRQGIEPASGAVVMTSRVSVELVQKCALAGCPALIAVSAPTAHAVRLAEAAGITLVAQVRDGGGAVMAHPGRITG